MKRSRLLMLLPLILIILIPFISPIQVNAAAPPIASADYWNAASGTCGFSTNGNIGDTVIAIAVAVSFTYNPKITDPDSNTYTRNNLITEGAHGLNIAIFRSSLTTPLTSAQVMTINDTGSSGFMISCMLFRGNYTIANVVSNNTIGTIMGPYNMSLGSTSASRHFGVVYGFSGQCLPTWVQAAGGSLTELADACVGQDEARLDQNVVSNSRGQMWQFANFAGSDMNSGVSAIFNLQFNAPTTTVTAWNTIDSGTPLTWIIMAIMLFLFPAFGWASIKAFGTPPSQTVFITVTTLFIGSLIGIMGDLEAGANAFIPMGVIVFNGLVFGIFIIRSRSKGTTQVEAE